jgi:hypothetical protein
VDLLQARALYHMSPRMFVRGVIQLRQTERNAALYEVPVTPAETRLLSQLLFSYKLNPQSVLFFGYADNQLGREEFTLTRENRTLFLKAGYSWRF